MENHVNGNLPDELLLEILWKLHVEDLLRCKCVCRAWYAIIDCPSFVDHHFGLDSNQESLLIQEDKVDNLIGKPYTFSLYQDEESPSRVEELKFLAQVPNSHNLLALLGPSNGVFCAVSNLGPLVVLFNPATRELKQLPPILYDDLPNMLVFGFGFDPSSRDYKVVAFQRWGTYPYSMCVYSLSSNSWKRTEAVDSLSPLTFVYDSVCHPFLNGVYHWLMEMAENGGVGILAWDMRSENFHVIEVPVCLRSRERNLHIATYGDSLAVLSYKFAEHVDLWARGRDGIWNKCVTVGPFPCGRVWPLCVWKKNMMFLEIEAIGIIRYDISTKKVTVILPKMEPAFVCGVFSYKESIISIKGVGDGADCVEDLFDRLPPAGRSIFLKGSRSFSPELVIRSFSQ